jgi:hypothetical protein
MPYVHLLLFLCRRCKQPIVMSVVSEAAKLEKVDGDSYHIKCQCGWFNNLLGVEASRHWVTPRHDQQAIINHLLGAAPNERALNS